MSRGEHSPSSRKTITEWIKNGERVGATVLASTALLASGCNTVSADTDQSSIDQLSGGAVVTAPQSSGAEKPQVDTTAEEQSNPESVVCESAPTVSAETVTALEEAVKGGQAYETYHALMTAIDEAGIEWVGIPATDFQVGMESDVESEYIAIAETITNNHNSLVGKLVEMVTDCNEDNFKAAKAIWDAYSVKLPDLESKGLGASKKWELISDNRIESLKDKSSDKSEGTDYYYSVYVDPVDITNIGTNAQTRHDTFAIRANHIVTSLGKEIDKNDYPFPTNIVFVNRGAINEGLSDSGYMFFAYSGTSDSINNVTAGLDDKNSFSYRKADTLSAK